MSTWDIHKWENGERIRPLTASEMRDQWEETVCQWIDAHEGLDSEAESDGLVLEMGEDLEIALQELLVASVQIQPKG